MYLTAAGSCDDPQQQQQQPHYDFDQDIDRRQVPALKYHSMVLGETTTKEEEEKLFVAGVADMDFAVAPCIQQALARRIQQPGGLVLGYEATPSDLLPAVCDWMKSRHDWDTELQPDHILRAPNILNALAMALCSFTEPGDEIIVQPPVFFDFFDIIAENHRTMVENPLQFNKGRYTMDLEHLQQVIVAHPRVKMLFLCNPHNPIGRVWTKEELQALADICCQHHVLIVSDEIHADLCYHNNKFTPMATVCPQENIITLTSPAKTFNIASCCCAFTIIADDTLRHRMKVENSKLTVNKNNALANVAMVAAYREGHGWLRDACDYLMKNIDVLRKGLESVTPTTPIRLVEPEGTFLVWLDCRSLPVDDSDGYALRRWFRTQAGWAVTRGAAFGRQGHGFVRVNIACPRRRLEKALQRLDKAVQELLAS